MKVKKFLKMDLKGFFQFLLKEVTRVFTVILNSSQILFSLNGNIVVSAYNKESKTWKKYSLKKYKLSYCSAKKFS